VQVLSYQPELQPELQQVRQRVLQELWEHKVKVLPRELLQEPQPELPLQQEPDSKDL
jgi:hypothetical protein